MGVTLESVAVPPLMEKAKSLASNAPLPPLVLYTASEKVTAIVELLAARDTDEIVGANLSLNAIAPVVWDDDMALSDASKILEPSTGVMVIVSTPLGVPVMLRKIRMTVSPPAKAVALASAVLSFCLTLLILAAVALPLFCAKVNVKSVASKAPLPPVAL